MKTKIDVPMTRRAAIAAAGMGAATLAGPAAFAQAQPAAKTFLLVHGAWHGGWCWRRVSDLLEKRGHKVFSPTLTGLGERAHLLNANINLDTHIADIVNVIKWEDLTGVCVVAHSYGGWPVSGALEQMQDRVASVVYLDAFMPEDGQKGIDFASEASRQGTLAAIAKGELSRPSPKAEAFHVNEKDRAWVDSKLTPQPVGVAMQPIKLTGAREKIAKKTYIRAPIFAQPAFDQALAAKKADPSWRTYELPCGHDVMVDMPDRLVEILLEVA
ncbi:MAG TPA: alpha/beta hydrolase family protein [Xanthobacteraceae bacterium]|jgi:pimeloyl-ACP methyl ester carboxylesterase